MLSPVSVRICAVLMLLAVAIRGISAFAQSPAPREFRVSLPDFKLRPREGIARIQCDIRAATIEQITNLPNGWTFEIANGDADVATIRAQSLIGAAFLRDTSYFKKFMIIKMDYPPNSPEGPPFTIDFRLAITTDPDDTAMREQDFSMHEVLLTPLDGTR